MKYLSALLLTLFCFNSYAQTLLKQTNITRMGIPYGNYSGIAHVNDSLYAVVSDKDDVDGFCFFNIQFDNKTGKIKSVVKSQPIKAKENAERVKRLSLGQRDIEGIAFRPSTNTFYISGEADQKILEYSYEGLPTGQELTIPAAYSIDNIQVNKGFEALTYNSVTHLFWTTTESALKTDKEQDTLMIRLQSFTEDLKPSLQYEYEMDKPLISKKILRFVHGVPDMLALDDGSIIVMEREALITPNYLGSYCLIKLYKVHPDNVIKQLSKQLICQFKTELTIGKMNFANYEGMCLGPRLGDGRQTILLINDSQNGEGNKIYRAKDYIKVIVSGNLIESRD